jgi:hypothetical protein
MTQDLAQLYITPEALSVIAEDAHNLIDTTGRWEILDLLLPVWRVRFRSSPLFLYFFEVAFVCSHQRCRLIVAWKANCQHIRGMIFSLHSCQLRKWNVSMIDIVKRRNNFPVLSRTYTLSAVAFCGLHRHLQTARLILLELQIQREFSLMLCQRTPLPQPKLNPCQRHLR